jgi:hypothetical protein
MARKPNNTESVLTDTVTPQGVVEGIDTITTQSESVQPLTPDFGKLAQTEHEISEGIQFPQADPVQQKDPRGRKPLTEAEREVARERKRERDRARYKKGGARAKDKNTGENLPDPNLGIAQANAQIVVATLDLLAKGISAGEFAPTPEMRAGTVTTWEAYLYAEGINLPPWVQVSIMSVIYVSPAFATPTGKGRLSGIGAKIKAWWIARKG